MSKITASTSASESFRLLDYMRSMFCRSVGWLQPTPGKIVWKNTKWRDPNNGKKMNQKEVEKYLNETITLCFKHKKIPSVFREEIQTLHTYIKNGKSNNKVSLIRLRKQISIREINKYLEQAIILNTSLGEDKLDLSDVLQTLQTNLSAGRRDVSEYIMVDADPVQTEPTDGDRQSVSRTSSPSVNDELNAINPTISLTCINPSSLNSNDIAPSSVIASPSLSCPFPSLQHQEDQQITVNTSNNLSTCLPSDLCPTNKNIPSHATNVTIPTFIKEYWEEDNIDKNQNLTNPSDLQQNISANPNFISSPPSIQKEKNPQSLELIACSNSSAVTSDWSVSTDKSRLYHQFLLSTDDALPSPSSTSACQLDQKHPPSPLSSSIYNIPYDESTVSKVCTFSTPMYSMSYFNNLSDGTGNQTVDDITAELFPDFFM